MSTASENVTQQAASDSVTLDPMEKRETITLDARARQRFYVGVGDRRLGNVAKAARPRRLPPGGTELALGVRGRAPSRPAR